MLKNNNFKVVLVEDNADLRDELDFQLSANGINITTVSDAIELDQFLSSTSCDIVILDIGLPGEDGLSIAGRLRKSHPELGIIILTARDGLESLLSGFKQGADAYLVKPVDWRELIAQIQALRLRIRRASTEETNTWVLREAGRKLVSPLGLSTKLTHMESQILTTLGQCSGQIVTRKKIIQVLQPKTPYNFDPRRLEVCISRLRQKIIMLMENSDTGKLTTADSPLKTVRGSGYIFTRAIKIENIS